jgi:hypothetical protein
MALSQLLFHARLLSEQPVHRLVEIVLGGGSELEFLGQCRGVPESRGGEFGAGIEESLGDHGEGEIALTAWFGGEHGIQAQSVHGAEDGLDVAVREIAIHQEGFGSREELLAGERAADQIDELGGEVRDIAEGLMLDLGADAKGATEEMGLIELALVGAGCCGHMNPAVSGRHGLLYG